MDPIWGCVEAGRPRCGEFVAWVGRIVLFSNSLDGRIVEWLSTAMFLRDCSNVPSRVLSRSRWADTQVRVAPCLGFNVILEQVTHFSTELLVRDLRRDATGEQNSQLFAIAIRVV